MSHEKDYSCENYGEKFRTKIQLSREDKLLCDVDIHVGKQVFSAHRIVLASNSDYFKTMFTTNMKEKYSQTVRLNEVTADAFEQVFDFIYTGKIKLTVDNVNEMMKTASLLLVESLLDIINDYLAETLDPLSALHLRETSRLFSLHKLEEKVEECIVENFGIVSAQKKFMEISEEDLWKYLSLDEISASEDELVSCLLNWIKADLLSRQEKFLSLFKLIRLQHVSVEYLLDTLRNDPLVKRNHDCRDLIEDAMHFHLKPEGIEKQPNRHGKQNAFLLTPTNSVHEISMSTSTSVKETSQPPMHVSHASAVVLHGDKLFFFGGYPNPNNNVATTSIISCNGRDWKNEGKMNYARANASAVSVQGSIYVFCGESNRCYVLQTEKFSGGQCVVDQQKQSDFARTYASSVAAGDTMFTFGGYHQHNFGALNMTTRINVKNGAKFNGHNLNHGRYSFGACVVGSKIFVCGGLNQQHQHINSVEVLDTTNINNNTPWTIVQQPCPYQLGRTSAVLFGNDQMLVLGESSDDLYCFDCTTSQWKREINKGDENQRTICKLGTAARGSKLFKF